MHYEALQELARERGARFARAAEAERLAAYARGRRQARRRYAFEVLGLLFGPRRAARPRGA